MMSSITIFRFRTGTHQNEEQDQSKNMRNPNPVLMLTQAGGLPVILHSPHPPGGWPQGTQEKKIKHVNISLA